MKDPIFLLQSGGPLTTEKIACSFSCYPVQYSSIEGLHKLDPELSRLKHVPVGSVEFSKAFANHVNLTLPSDFSYGIVEGDLDKFLHRELRKGIYSEASLTDFVKPLDIKTFTGNVKGHLERESQESIAPETPVWITPSVPFGAEFRFYIQSLVNKSLILGWSRYDESNMDCPEPDLKLVDEVVEYLRQIGEPTAYTVDIGWRPDLNRYCVVELNDAWSLGFYENNDPQSNPPTRQQYADMLVSRWTQIVFCGLLE